MQTPTELKIREVLEKFGKDLFIKHFGVDDFGCEGCDKYVSDALSEISKLFMTEEEILEVLNTGWVRAEPYYDIEIVAKALTITKPQVMEVKATACSCGNSTTLKD